MADPPGRRDGDRAMAATITKFSWIGNDSWHARSGRTCESDGRSGRTRRMTWGSRATRWAPAGSCGRCPRTGRGGTGTRAGGPTRPSGRWSPPASAGSAMPPSGSARRCARGRAPSPTSTGRRGRWPARCAADGVGPGDVVLFQLPNWVEAGITFWAAAYLGAVVVPIVHFYGRQGGRLHPGRDRVAGGGGHRRPLRAQRLPGHLRADSCPADPGPGGWWWADRPTATSRRGRVPFESYLGADPLAGPVPVDPDAPAIIGFTSGTTRDPKGVIHSHRTIGCETRQLDYMFPNGGPPKITGAPVGHFIGMLNAFLVPLLRDAVGQPDRRLGPGRGAADDARGGPRRRRRGHLLPHQPARPPGLHPRAPGPHAVRRTGRLAGAGGGDPSGHRPRDQGVPLLRQHRAPVDHRLPARRPRGEAADHRRPGAARGGAPPRRRRPDPQPRARLLRRLHRPRADRGRASTRTAGTAPATSACSTTTATSPSPTASPTSSSGAARTSAPPRSRSC